MSKPGMSKIGKRLQKARSTVESGKLYSVEEGVQLLERSPRAKFDETVEIAVRLGVDPRKAEENVRGTVELPHGTGKSVRVACFCKSERAKEAEEAGADFIGAEDLVQKILDGWMEFDSTVATPDVMVLVSKVGKLLGPRGLMPNPKVGTVTFEVGKAIRAIKAGRVEYRVEKAGIVQAGIGKISFGPERVRDNIISFLDSVVKAKPRTAKGVYLQAVYISTTMGASVALNPVPFREV